MGGKNPGVITPRNCDATVRQAIQQLATKVIGLESTPEFAGLTLTGLTASRLLSTDASKVSESVADLTSWIAGTVNEVNVADDGDGTITLSTPQDIHTAATPTFAGLTITGNSVFGVNSSIFQPVADSTTFFQILDADGGTPIFNVDSTNERVGIGGISTGAKLYIAGYTDIVLSGKDGAGESGILQSLSDAKTIGDSIGWNFNLRNSVDSSANYAKFIVGITDPTVGALKGFFSVHTVGSVDGVVERFRIDDVGLCTIAGDLAAVGGTFTGVVDASAGEVLVEDNATVAPTGKADGYMGVAKIGADGRIYFTVEETMYFIDGTAAVVPVTGNPIGLLLALTYS